MGRLVLLCVVCAGCLQTNLVPCGELLCPSGEVCGAGNRCVSPAQVEACTGHAEGEDCVVGTSPGLCMDGACVATGCGNSVVDPDEVCDDGNQTSGDGCRADCRKIEKCGDGIVDTGEGCDDGNTNAADGCDACAPTTWRATAVVAGTTEPTKISLASVTDVATDLAGNVFIADVVDGRIFRLDTGGNLISTAQVPASSLATDGLGNVYASTTAGIERIDPRGTVTSLTTEQGGVAIDGLGQAYVAEYGRIVRVNLDGSIDTIAGTGTAGYSGDGGPATLAQVSASRLAIGPNGDLYFGDFIGKRVRRIDAQGIVTTVAGNGGALSSGDGGPATSAAIDGPMAIAFDTTGNLYIATASSTVRRVDTNGIISTISGVGGYVRGLAVDRFGNLYTANADTRFIERRDPSGTVVTAVGNGLFGYRGDGGAATSAEVTSAFAVEVGSAGTLYVADQQGSRVLRVDTLGTITTVAGTGIYGDSGDGGPATAAQLSFPIDLAADGAGNLYIADTDNYRVRRIDPNGIITTIAGTGVWGWSGDGGPATAARIGGPTGLDLDASGNLYFSDDAGHVRRVDTNGVITTVAGTGTAGFSGDGGPATAAELRYPQDVVVDATGQLYIADLGNSRVRRVATNGTITTIAGNGTNACDGDGGAATAAGLDYASSVAVDSAGNVYVSTTNCHKVRRIDPAGTITTITGGGAAGGSTWGFDGDGGPAGAALLNSPWGLTVDASDRLYIADSENKAIRRIANGNISSVVGPIDPEGMGPKARAHLADARALVITPSFTLFAGGSTGTVQAWRNATEYLEVVSGRYPQPLAAGSLARYRGQDFGAVSGVAYDATSSSIYVTESTNDAIHTIHVTDPADKNAWTIATLVGMGNGFADGALATAKFRTPTGLYLDESTAQLYVADTGNHVVRAIDLTHQTVHTVAGTPAVRGYFGDGGAATAALLHAPQAITRCPNGDLFIADTGNNRVRRIVASGAITTVLGDGVAASSGEGKPASTFPVDTPLGLACDTTGNLYVTSTTAVRLLPANDQRVVDGTGGVQTIFGKTSDTFPASVTRCLTGLALVDAETVQVTDACAGLLVQLHRER